MPTSKKKLRRQYAALPVRQSDDGKLMVLLLTSRGTRRWIIPKGWPMRNLSASKAAMREAYEEAGIEGKIVSEIPIGRYTYEKQLTENRSSRIEVDVFLMHVSRQLPNWPERAERETAWFTPEDAAKLVAEPELATILIGLNEETFVF